MEANNIPRIPLEHNGIQYNFCKNPKCSNFGVPATQSKTYGNNAYTLVGGGKDFPLLKCSCCGETPPLKSNQGIYEEVERLSSYLKIATDSPCCSNQACSNHTVPVGTKKAHKNSSTYRKSTELLKSIAQTYEEHSKREDIEVEESNIPFFVKN